MVLFCGFLVAVSIYFPSLTILSTSNSYAGGKNENSSELQWQVRMALIGTLYLMIPAIAISFMLNFSYCVKNGKQRSL